MCFPISFLGGGPKPKLLRLLHLAAPDPLLLYQRLLLLRVIEVVLIDEAALERWRLAFKEGRAKR
jgi:hypothetical protein